MSYFGSMSLGILRYIILSHTGFRYLPAVAQSLSVLRDMMELQENWFLSCIMILHNTPRPCRCNFTFIPYASGPEYLTNEFRTYLQNHSVALSVTQPYSPEMNSIAERAMRKIIEHASAMLWCLASWILVSGYRNICLPFGPFSALCFD